MVVLAFMKPIETGRGRVVVRARTSFETDEDNGRVSIMFMITLSSE